MYWRGLEQPMVCSIPILHNKVTDWLMTERNPLSKYGALHDLFFLKDQHCAAFHPPQEVQFCQALFPLCSLSSFSPMIYYFMYLIFLETMKILVVWFLSVLKPICSFDIFYRRGLFMKVIYFTYSIVLEISHGSYHISSHCFHIMYVLLFTSLCPLLESLPMSSET